MSKVWTATNEMTLHYLLGGPCGAHVFEEFFGLEDEPVKSVKRRSKQGPGYWRLPHEFALCSFLFRFALRVSVMFHCVEPIRKKTNKRAVSFRLKARALRATQTLLQGR